MSSIYGFDFSLLPSVEEFDHNVTHCNNYGDLRVFLCNVDLFHERTENLWRALQAYKHCIPSLIRKKKIRAMTIIYKLYQSLYSGCPFDLSPFDPVWSKEMQPIMFCVEGFEGRGTYAFLKNQLKSLLDPDVMDVDSNSKMIEMFNLKMKNVIGFIQACWNEMCSKKLVGRFNLIEWKSDLSRFRDVQFKELAHPPIINSRDDWEKLFKTDGELLACHFQSFMTERTDETFTHPGKNKRKHIFLRSLFLNHIDNDDDSDGRS